jgi:hypothetical protein
MPLRLVQSILATVSYADVFDYPLNRRELHSWLIGRKTKLQDLDPVLKHLTGNPVDDQLYFCLSGGKSIIQKRQHRKNNAAVKFQIARKLSHRLNLIPTLRYIGITGSLAIGNCDPADDIDLFFITVPQTIWITRLLVIFLTDIFSSRRKAGDSMVDNKICLNMFITSDALGFAKSRQNLFLAHEIMQMQTLADRDSLYQKMLAENTWVGKFLPNIRTEKNPQEKSGKIRLMQRDIPEEVSSKYDFFTSIFINILGLFELPAKYLQLTYMQKRRTTEEITDRILRFHPRDTGNWVYREFKKRLDRLNIPIDKVFYGHIK